MELHRRICSVSHFQLDLIEKGAPLLEHDAGDALVNFLGAHVNVSTAWDDNGAVPPHVEVIVTGFDAPPLDGFPPLKALATAAFDASGSGLEIGNYISNDIASVPLPAGRYWLLVSADTREPFTARVVHFHFWPRS
jgi:hypothetical protein